MLHRIPASRMQELGVVSIVLLKPSLSSHGQHRHRFCQCEIQFVSRTQRGALGQSGPWRCGGCPGWATSKNMCCWFTGRSLFFLGSPWDLRTETCWCSSMFGCCWTRTPNIEWFLWLKIFTGTGPSVPHIWSANSSQTVHTTSECHACSPTLFVELQMDVMNGFKWQLLAHVFNMCLSCISAESAVPFRSRSPLS